MSVQTWKLPNCNSLRVLLVEEDDEVAATLKEFLERYACQVTRVTNGVEGLQKVMVAEYNVILCDMVTPTFPGDKFFMAVQRIQPRSCERFIFMTGHMADPKWDAFIRSVHGLMLWRPFQMCELLAAIHTVLKRTRIQEVKDWYSLVMKGTPGPGREKTEPGPYYPPRQANGHMQDFRQPVSVTAADSNPPHQSNSPFEAGHEAV